MELTPTPEQRSFRDEVRAWLRGNMPRQWTARLAASSDVPRAEAYDLLRDWQRRLHAAGFIGLTWPREYGGRGLTFMEEMILAEEMALAKAPPVLNILGIGMAGPTIMAYGTEEQKQRHLPKILSADEIWCQGYSEPNAGSDLASLQTRAVRDGRDYVVDGQKVWTSLAHTADWMMLLARTDPDAPRHKGITYFLLDMHLPGVTVKPLRQITGDAEFNEVFFDGVRVHDSQVLGGVNNGWAGTHQRLQELAMEVQGPYAQLVKGSDWAVEDGLWQHAFLRSRANSIEGGTTEIQKNIIGERVLGLPKG